MQKSKMGIVSKWLFYISMALIVYMPLHVFIVQSASLVTGGIEAWKAAKDILLVGLVPVLLYASYKRGLHTDKTFRKLLFLGGGYGAIHLLFIIFDKNDDTYSAIVGSVYNVRILGYLLLGYVVGSSKKGTVYLKYLLTTSVIIASIVALFGVLQYFLPHDLLESVGYTLDRGVKPLFFIDDRPDLPRVMSTLKDPNSFGAYLILPTLLTGYALLKKTINEKLFIRPFRRKTLAVMLILQLTALFLTFSRGAFIGLILSLLVLVSLTSAKVSPAIWKRAKYTAVILLIMLAGTVFVVRDSAIVQDYVFHAATTTNQDSPNEKRITLLRDSVDEIINEPLGHGPGSAGLVSINNPKGGALTENYYLQIAYEIGWLGLGLFLAALYVITRRLQEAPILNHEEKYIAQVLLAGLAGYAFYSLLIHLWSNEAVALQWWLIAGTAFGVRRVKIG